VPGFVHVAEGFSPTVLVRRCPPDGAHTVGDAGGGSGQIYKSAPTALGGHTGLPLPLWADTQVCPIALGRHTGLPLPLWTDTQVCSYCQTAG